MYTNMKSETAVKLALAPIFLLIAGFIFFEFIRTSYEMLTSTDPLEVTVAITGSLFLIWFIFWMYKAYKLVDDD